MSRRDPVTTDLYDEVLAADGHRCVARVIEPTVDLCRNRWNDPIIASGRFPRSALTLDHVRDHPMMGKRAPSDFRHLATLCWHHHLDGWATSHRVELREYLARRSGSTL